uniref:C6 domain-containing protein n=1 Tax=Strongyloides papillosus TaxID=174720 RepID=A0A0N5BC27_STREA
MYGCAPTTGGGGVKPTVTTTTTTTTTAAATTTTTTTTQAVSTTTTTASSLSTTTTLTSTTITSTLDCCPALVQTFEGVTFADGNLTLTYDDDNCRTFVDMFCTQPLEDLELYAAIVVNTNNFMNYDFMNVTWNATCSNGVWITGDPPLQIETLQCLLTEPAT